MQSNRQTKQDTRRAAEAGYRRALTTFFVTVCKRERLSLTGFGQKYGPLLEHIGVTITGNSASLNDYLKFKTPKGMKTEDMARLTTLIGNRTPVSKRVKLDAPKDEFVLPTGKHPNWRKKAEVPILPEDVDEFLGRSE